MLFLSFSYSSGLCCPDSCSSHCYYVILSSPVLITSWRTGPLMLISECPCVSTTWEVVGAAAMRDCDVSHHVYTMTVVTPSQSCFCQGPLTRSSLSLRQRSPLHLTPIPPHAVMSTAPPVTYRAVSLRCSLTGWWHAELSHQWAACVEIKVGWRLLMRQT